MNEIKLYQDCLSLTAEAAYEWMRKWKPYVNQSRRTDYDEFSDLALNEWIQKK